jgi:hypothetical protein
MESILAIIAVSAVGLTITKNISEKFVPIGDNTHYSKHISISNPKHINKNAPVVESRKSVIPPSLDRNIIRAPNNIYYTNGGPTSQIMDSSLKYREALGGIPEDKIEKQPMKNDVSPIIKENEQLMNLEETKRTLEYSKLSNRYENDKLPQIPDFSATSAQRGDKGLNSGTFSLDDLKNIPSKYILGNSRPIEELDRNRVLEPGVGSLYNSVGKQTVHNKQSYIKDKTISINRMNTPGNPQSMYRLQDKPEFFNKKRDSTIDVQI